MTKAKQRPSELKQLAAQVRTVLRRQTSDVILLGNLLIKSRKYLEHGDWQDWLVTNFEFSYQSALNYVSAAEYVER
jgi:hypothetical protein